MRKLITIFMIGVTLMLTACSAQKIDSYTDTQPHIALEDYFNGHIKGWGILQDRSGKVTRRFDVNMHGSWKDGIGTLKEKFTFYDEEKQERTWTIKKMSDGRYQGTAGDILDAAKGQTNGSAVQWSYVMDLPVGDTTYKISFDDWMFLMNDNVLFNRSYLKKFGFKVAELTIFMQKQDK